MSGIKRKMKGIKIAVFYYDKNWAKDKILWLLGEKAHRVRSSLDKFYLTSKDYEVGFFDVHKPVRVEDFDKVLVQRADGGWAELSPLGRD